MSGIDLAPEERQLHRIVEAIRQIAQGRSNAVGTVTLADGATETAVVAINCGKDSRVFLFPTTANAADALATTYVAAADVVQGGFTITHANDVTTDRTFNWIAIG